MEYLKADTLPMRQTLQLGRPPSTPRARRSISSTTVLGFAGRNHRDEATSSHITYERVLRYPDGHVRRIRYPIEPQAVRQSFGDVVEEEGEMWETGNVTRVARGWQIQGTTATMRAPRTQPNQVSVYIHVCIDFCCSCTRILTSNEENNFTVG